MHGGGGERKRKAGAPLELDWDKLLPSGQRDDDEPPPVVVIEAAAVGKSKPSQVAAMMIDDGDDDSLSGEFLRNLSDEKLIDKIARLKKNSSLESRLSDGGVKLRASVKKYEAELERRKLLKGDDKCKKDPPSIGESTCNVATADSLPVGDPLDVPASQSTFARHFYSKMDDRKATMSFRGELSILNRCDNKNMRENRQFPNRRTHKMYLSSRESPFRSPNLLSVKTDNPPQSNGEQSGSRSSTPSPHLSDRDVSGCLPKKENAPCFQSTPNSRRYNKTVALVDEEELEVDEPVQADKEDLSNKKLWITYPSRDDPIAVDISYKDMECLSPQSYLSSNIINFYILYLQKPKSPTPRKSCDYHFFNTYFYVRLKRDVLNKIDKEASFVKCRRWWKGVNLFEKAYIFLPIHENLHWSLIIICIPNKEDQSGPIILHLDSLGLHTSKSIFDDVKSFLIEEWKFLRQEDVLPELPIADNIWDKLSRRIDEKVIEVPQQRNEYDCGLFVLYFIERFINEAPERLKKKDLEMFGRQWFKPKEASSLRQKISNLLKYEFEKAKENICELDD